MTEDNAKNKLTLSGKSTLTLKGLGEGARTHNRDGKRSFRLKSAKNGLLTRRPSKRKK